MSPVVKKKIGKHLISQLMRKESVSLIWSETHLDSYWDHIITLQRAAQIFQVQFLVVSTLGVDASSVVSPSGEYSEDLPTLVVGHIAEGHGDHYVSLDGQISQYISGIQEEESHWITSRRRIESSPTHEFEVNSGSDHLIIHSKNV